MREGSCWAPRHCCTLLVVNTARFYLINGPTERDLEWNTQCLGDVNMRKGRRVGNDCVRDESSPVWTVGLRTRLPAAAEDFRHGCPIAGDIPVREGLEAGNQTGVYSEYVLCSERKRSE